MELDDGSVDRYHANILAEHIYAQVDDDGYTMLKVDEILDHRSNEHAVRKTAATLDEVPKTTKGWELCVRWKNGDSQWIPLKDMKESNPIELAEYAHANNLAEEPAFAWWVPYTIRKRNRILKAMQKRYYRTTQKYGVELPHSLKRAFEIDNETGTTFWQDALAKEMKGVRKAFKILEEDDTHPVGYTKVSCHLVFDVKMTLQRKVRLVCNGAKVDPPVTVCTFASVVSRESVRIAFMLAALNGLDLEGADISNAYINADSRERLCTVCGPEFGEYKGRWAIIVKALYGSKSAAASWRAAIIKALRDQGFVPCRADNDVMMRPAVKADGAKVYEYVLIYSDDLLVVAVNPSEILSKVDQHYKVKDGSDGVPTRYLGANISKYTLPDGTWAWAIGSDEYCKTAVENVEAWLLRKHEHLKTKTSSVFPSGWKPETDVSGLLRDGDASYYSSQIGILRWLVELGRMDIAVEVSQLAAFSAAPREGHLAAVLHLYAYLKSHKRCKIVMDPTYKLHAATVKHAWEDFYQDAKELIPHDAPETRGKAVQQTCFVDSDHAGDLVSRRSRTGVLIFLNSAPIVWYTKKQGSIETSSFGSEFSAMKTGLELVLGLRYKLRMMGVELDGPCHVKADNMSVINNVSNPTSVLKKKSNSVAFHFSREVVASGAAEVTYENTKTNLADMLTKSQPGVVRTGLSDRVMK